MGLRWLALPQVQELELKAFDHLMSLRQHEAEDSRLLIVTITDEDVRNDNDVDFRSSHLGDATLAKLIERLEKYKPKVIGLDMHRADPQKQGRDKLINRFQRNKNIITVCSFGKSANSPSYNPPSEFSEKQRKYQVGFSDFDVDKQADNNGRFVRRQLLSYDSKKFSPSSPLCNTPFSLSLQLAHRYLNLNNTKSPITIENGKWKFGQTIIEPFAARTGAYQQLDGSSQILLNYRSKEPAKTVTLSKVLNETLNNNLVKDRIIIIGYANDNSTEESVSKDSFDTPYGRMPGVLIHAHMVSQILSFVMEKRPLLWVLPQWHDIQWGDAVLVLVCSVTGGVLALCFRSPLQALLAGGAATLIWHQICLVILIQGGWMPFVPSTLSLWFTGVCIYVVIQIRHS